MRGLLGGQLAVVTGGGSGNRTSDFPRVRQPGGARPLGCARKAEDIVGPAVFLASDLSAYVTGSIILVDGGYRVI